jgi:hypothetical protein
LPTTPQKAHNLGKFLFKKSVGRSAHHQHALFDNLKYGATFDSDIIFSTGDSRGAMTGEAVDAIAPEYNRQVGYSDYIAGCFEHNPTPVELLKLIQTPVKEMIALGKLGCRMAREELISGNIGDSFDYLGTFDLHPMNLLHETAWLYPLITGDAGKYAKAVPLDSIGVRTLLRGDTMSQHKAWEATHSVRPGIRFIIEEGSHLNLANPEIQQARVNRFTRLLDEMKRTNFRLPEIDFSHVISAPARLRSVT